MKRQKQAKNKPLKIILTILVVILAVVLLAGIIAFIGFKFVIAPKFNQNITNKDEQLTASDFVGFAADLSDKQIVDNIINFDKESAKEALTALQEIGEEENISVTLPPASTQNTVEKDVKDNNLQSAYDRIMAAAEKEEISEGLEILKKVSISKVTELRAAGNYTELKKYIRSVLTHEEIVVALKLYTKYKHLL